MREVDRLTVKQHGIPSIILMENAANAVARVIEEKLGEPIKEKRVLILCGKGNNGGDGAALGRILGLEGAFVDLLLLGDLEDTKGDARSSFESYLNGEPVVDGEATSDFGDFLQIKSFQEWLDYYNDQNWDVVVDAILGTGLTRPLDEWVSRILSDVNSIADAQNSFLRIAIDIPSGLDADNPQEGGEVFSADVTVTFTAPKLANVMSPGSRFSRELRIANIGSPYSLVSELESDTLVAEPADATMWLSDSRFTSQSYKNKRGHALIIGGSRNFSGAVVLAGNSAIRSGVGLATIAVPEDTRDGAIGRVVPEVMVRGLSQTESGSAAEKAADELTDFLEGIDCVAIGTGLSSKEDETKRFVRRVVAERQTPVVIDADAITAMSPWDTKGSDELPLILTPHEGEFKRMLGVEGDEAKEILKDRIGAARGFATKHNVYLVLKGERNLIASPDGRVVINPTGNPGLGKAGNGDTLTGIVAGFVAQAVQMKIDIFETLVAAVYIAGMAGDVAAKKYGKRFMTASDVKDCLMDVFAELEPA